MKKLLLTLGTAATFAAPLATVVACGEEGQITLKGTSEVVDGHLTISGFVGPTYTEDEVNDDYEAVLLRLSTFSNLMGVELVAGGSGVTKVTLNGELAGNDGKLTEISHTTDFAKVSSADSLEEYISTFTGDSDDSASGQAFMILSTGNAEDGGGAPDEGNDPNEGNDQEESVDVTAELATITANVDALTVRTGWDGINYDYYLGGDVQIADLQTSGAIKSDTFDSVILDGWTLERLSWDGDAGNHNLIVKYAEVEYSIPTKVLNWEESIAEATDYLANTSFTREWDPQSDWTGSIGDMYNWIGISTSQLDPIVWGRFEYQIVVTYADKKAVIVFEHMDSPYVKETRDFFTW